MNSSRLNHWRVCLVARKLPAWPTWRMMAVARGSSETSMPRTSRRAMPISSLSITSFSRLKQLSKSIMPAPETMFTPARAAMMLPMPDSKPTWASTILASLMPM